MFQSAEIGHKLSKATYREAVPELRAALLAAQVDLFEQHRTPVVVLISGQDGAGKGETINQLYEWMDPRFISTLAFSQPSDEERERPPMWRYWRSLPPKGRIGMFAGSWYSDPIRERIEGAPVTLNPEKVRPPALVRYVTKNQIQIRVPNDMEQVVEVKDDMIIIHDPLEDRYDDTERAR